jgi:hypothetical protein
MADDKIKGNIRRDFESGVATFKRLSERYDIKEGTIKSWASREGWKKGKAAGGKKKDVVATKIKKKVAVATKPTREKKPQKPIKTPKKVATAALKDNSEKVATKVAVAKQSETEIMMDEPKARIIETALNLGFDATIVDVCRQANVSRVTFYRWLDNDPIFEDAYRNLWKRELKGEIPQTVRAILKKAHSGDLAAARLHLEMAGVLSIPNGGPTINNMIQNNVADVPTTPADRQVRINELIGKRGTGASMAS